MVRFIHRFLATEAAGGVALMLAAVLAMVFANTGLREGYEALLTWKLPLSFGEARVLDKDFSHWINDGLMVLFFLLIGLEIKRELLEGELNSARKAALPAIAALGGMVCPALIFLLFNIHTEYARGWAVAGATDIAFSLGVLSLLGSRAPFVLKIFLMAVAVIGNLIAVVILALFYSAELKPDMLLYAAISLAALLGLNLLRVRLLVPYLALGAVLWFFTLQSGIHATIAGVLLGFVIPLRTTGTATPPSERLIHHLHPWVAFGIMPLFAFANAGINLGEIHLADLDRPLPLGIALGLFFGKQLGIFAFSFLAVKWGLASKPAGVPWPAFYGICILGGIGFTISLFIGTLAFGDDMQAMHAMRMGVVIGSLCSAVAGYIFLSSLLNRRYAPS